MKGTLLFDDTSSQVIVLPWCRRSASSRFWRARAGVPQTFGCDVCQRRLRYPPGSFPWFDRVGGRPPPRRAGPPGILTVHARACHSNDLGMRDEHDVDGFFPPQPFQNLPSTRSRPRSLPLKVGVAQRLYPRRALLRLQGPSFRKFSICGMVESVVPAGRHRSRRCGNGCWTTPSRGTNEISARGRAWSITWPPQTDGPCITTAGSMSCPYRGERAACLMVLEDVTERVRLCPGCRAGGAISIGAGAHRDAGRERRVCPGADE